MVARRSVELLIGGEREKDRERERERERERVCWCEVGVIA